MAAVRELDRRRIQELHARELATLRGRTARSEALFRRAERTLAGGVASSYQLHDPWPVHMTRGEGSHVLDVDGNDYLDFHNGFGAMVQGHAHPAIGRRWRVGSWRGPTSARPPRKRSSWPRS